MSGLDLKDWKIRIALVFFSLLSIWWLQIFVSGLKETRENYAFAAIYGLICLWGGYWGLVSSKKWGGFSSVVGRAIILLSCGLLAQEFGQLVFSFYNVFLHVEIPYPSLADIGFFGSVLIYICGIYQLFRAAGSGFSLKKLPNQIFAIALPLLMLSVGYILFLRGYQFDFKHPLKIALDFGYPFGEALYISIAVLTFTLSRRLLGGIMRNSIILFIIAFVVQFAADYNFLYQNNNNSWINGGYGDYLYFLAYTLMALSLIKLRITYNKIEMS